MKSAPFGFRQMRLGVVSDVEVSEVVVVLEGAVTLDVDEYNVKSVMDLPTSTTGLMTAGPLTQWGVVDRVRKVYFTGVPAPTSPTERNR